MISIFKYVWIIVGVVYWLRIYVLNKVKYDGTNEYTDIDRALQLIFFPITGIVCALNFIFYGNLNFLK